MKKLTWEKCDVDEEESEEETAFIKQFPVKLLSENLSDDFNLWIAYTNFNISRQDIENIESINGVESLDVYSRYRIRVGIGKLFKEDKVKEDIEYILDCSSQLETLDEETKTEVDALIKTFEEEKFWAIIILPNAKVTSYVGKDEKDFGEKLTFFEQIQEITSCQIVTSQDK